MKWEGDYKFGQPLYLKNDPDQRKYLLNRIILEPKGRICLEVLSDAGELLQILEMHISKEKDIVRTFENNSKGEDD